MSHTAPQPQTPPRPSCRIIRQAFVRGIGVVYFIAIVSLWVQIQGLIGSHGILPVRHYLDLLRQVFPNDWFWRNPSLIWLDPSDGFLNFLCGAGVVLSLLVVSGIIQAPALALLWIIYLSLMVAGQEFLGFQWDALLLEAGLLAVFFAPTQLIPRLSNQTEPSQILLWLIRWLLFRLMFLSGLVKLLSGDSSWRDGTAMNYHYLTQPLPAWTSYWAYQLPGWFQWLSVWIMFFIELLAPIFIFAGDVAAFVGSALRTDSIVLRIMVRNADPTKAATPSNRFTGSQRRLRFGRRWRQAAFALLVSLQLLIAATGNFGFFNLLAMLLCVSLLDDGVLPRRARDWLMHTRRPAVHGVGGNNPDDPDDPAAPVAKPDWRLSPRLLCTGLLAVVIVALTTLTGILECIRTVDYRATIPDALQTAVEWVEPFRSTNGYGLFRVMTRERNEIIIEGSDDGVDWKPYEFKYKPGNPYRRPGFCTPHMPRLDWQMWFGVFGGANQNRWFIPLLKRLLAGEPRVLALLETSPFPGHPPKYIRAIVYNYRFAPVGAEGRWWYRTYLGIYFPPRTLAEMLRALPEPDIDFLIDFDHGANKMLTRGPPWRGCRVLFDKRDRRWL